MTRYQEVSFEICRPALKYNEVTDPDERTVKKIALKRSFEN